MTYDSRLKNARGTLFPNLNMNRPSAPALEGYIDLNGDYNHAPRRIPCKAWIKEAAPYKKHYQLAFGGMTAELKFDWRLPKDHLPELLGFLSDDRHGIVGWIRYDEHGKWRIEIEIRFLADFETDAERDARQCEPDQSKRHSSREASFI